MARAVIGFFDPHSFRLKGALMQMFGADGFDALVEQTAPDLEAAFSDVGLLTRRRRMAEQIHLTYDQMQAAGRLLIGADRDETLAYLRDHPDETELLFHDLNGVFLEDLRMESPDIARAVAGPNRDVVQYAFAI